MADMWTEVFSKEELTKEITALSPAEAQEVLKKNGYEFTLEEVEEQAALVKETLEKYSKGELDEEDLNDVSGGGHGGALCAGILVGLAIASGAW